MKATGGRSVPKAGGVAARAALPGSADVRQSLLLPTVFERLEGQPPFTILDVNAGVSETIRFFADYPTRLHFAAFYDAVELANAPEEEPDAYYDAIFAELCSFPPGTQFDICLLWDFLNCLPEIAITAFSRAIRPYLHRDTIGHGFGAFKASVSVSANPGGLPALSYGVRTRSELVLRPRESGLQPRYLHPRTVLAESLTSFGISRGTLLKDGIMELLLEAR